MDGFRYNGIHSDFFSCYYIPDESTLFDDKVDFEVYDDEPGWKSGGLYYGTRVKPREFVLSCFFEDITREQKEKMMQWLDRKTSGDLIFDARPFVRYKVRPTKKVNGKIYTQNYAHLAGDRYSGTFDVTFTAYDPYGYLLYSSYDGMDHDGAAQYCGMIDKSMMPSSPAAPSTYFNVYNPGTERCGCVIRIGGSGTDITIANDANQHKCKLMELPSGNKYLEIDSVNGTVMEVDPSTNKKTMAFHYSNDGYVMLESFGAVYEEYFVRYTNGSNVVMIDGLNDGADVINKWMRLGGGWRRIASKTANGYVIDSSMKSSGGESTRLVTMNTIRISGTGLSLNRIEIDYEPRIQ